MRKCLTAGCAIILHGIAGFTYLTNVLCLTNFAPWNADKRRNSNLNSLIVNRSRRSRRIRRRRSKRNCCIRIHIWATDKSSVVLLLNSCEVDECIVACRIYIRNYRSVQWKVEILFITNKTWLNTPNSFIKSITFIYCFLINSQKRTIRMLKVYLPFHNTHCISYLGNGIEFPCLRPRYANRRFKTIDMRISPRIDKLRVACKWKDLSRLLKR